MHANELININLFSCHPKKAEEENNQGLCNFKDQRLLIIPDKEKPFPMYSKKMNSRHQKSMAVHNLLEVTVESMP